MQGNYLKSGIKYKDWFKNECPEEEVFRAKHKFRQDFSFWHDYTDIQIERALELTEILVEKYNLRDILGHEDIAPTRKIDPGPAFPLENIRSAILGRVEEEDELYEVSVSSLNIRRGPGIEYDIVSSPLSRGIKVSLLEMRDRWSKVDVEGENDFEGWVYNKYIKKIN